MKIICHRGMWESKEEQNTKKALLRSLVFGFGFETDIRDVDKKLVVCHDAFGISSLPLDEVLEELSLYKDHPLIALNIKADGLSSKLEEKINHYKISNYFVFDMSLPETLNYFKKNLKVFLRLSEYETFPNLFEACEGIWLDCFKSEWYDMSLVYKILDAGKKVCLVSPELHGRSEITLWSRLRDEKLCRNNNIFICTDKPVKAMEFFKI